MWGGGEVDKSRRAGEASGKVPTLGGEGVKNEQSEEGEGQGEAAISGYTKLEMKLVAGINFLTSPPRRQTSKKHLTVREPIRLEEKKKKSTRTRNHPLCIMRKTLSLPRWLSAPLASHTTFSPVIARSSTMLVGQGASSVSELWSTKTAASQRGEMRNLHQPAVRRRQPPTWHPASKIKQEQGESGWFTPPPCLPPLLFPSRYGRSTRGRPTAESSTPSPARPGSLPPRGCASLPRPRFS